MLPLTDSIEQALLLNESESVIDLAHFQKPNGGAGEVGTIRKINNPSQEPLRKKARLIKDNYIQQKLSV
jgi:hypothetical protein